ncbi:MAG: hypothetical protein SNJ57_10045 [Cyanobacteriota bacterium]
MYPQDTATILLIDDSDADAQAFRLQIGKNPQIRYPVEVVHVKSLAEAIAWLSQHESPYLICIDVTAMEQHGTSFAQEQVKTLNRYAPTVWISDDSSTEQVARLMQKFGVQQQEVFQKQSTLWGQDQTQFLTLLNEIVSRRSSGRSREIQMDLVRLDERVQTIDRELRELAEAVEKIRATLFEGGSNSVVAIALRYSQLADSYAQSRQVRELEDRLKKLETLVEEERSQIRLRKTEMWLNLLSRLGFWGTVAAFLLLFTAFIGLERAIELIKVLLAD